MDILKAFYDRIYENDINKKMLYYNYDFPKDEVKEYVQQVLSIPLDRFVQYDVEMETTEAIMSKDVFQFSSLEAGTERVCQELIKHDNLGVTFIQAGKFLLDDGKQRNDAAYVKYGENHLKTAEALGLLYELTHTYFVSCIGMVYVSLDEEDRNKLLVRLFLRNKFIARLIKVTHNGNVDVRQFLYMLSDTTYVRRRSNIRSILRYLQESTEYDFTAIISRIKFPKP